MALPSVTPAQYRALEAIADGPVSWSPGVNTPAYFRVPARVRTDTVQRVLNARLAVRPAKRTGHFGAIAVELTDLGRQVLDAKRGEG